MLKLYYLSVLTSLFTGCDTKVADYHLFHLIFRKVNDDRLLRVLALLHLVQTSMDDRFHGKR